MQIGSGGSVLFLFFPLELSEQKQKLPVSSFTIDRNQVDDRGEHKQQTRIVFIYSTSRVERDGEQLVIKYIYIAPAAPAPAQYYI